MQPTEKKLTIDQTLLVLQAQVEVLRFRVRRLVGILEQDNLKDLLDLLEAEYLRKHGKPFDEGANREAR